MKKKRVAVATIKPWNIFEVRVFIKQNSDLNVKVFSSKKEFTIKAIKKFQPDYIFFPHWSWKIPKGIYRKFNCIGFHMTDLPYGRGGSPLQNLIVRRHKHTKVSAIQIVDEFDAGGVYLKKSLSLKGSAADIFKRMAQLIFRQMIPYIINKKLSPKKQKGKVVNFKRRKFEESSLEKVSSVREIYDHIRMLDAEGYPQAFLRFNDFMVEFYQAKLSSKRKEVEAKVKIRKIS